MNRQYLDAALKGRYPAEMAEIFGEAWPDWPEQDLRDICQPLDFIGTNYYTRNVVRDDPDQWPLRASPVPQHANYTATAWEVHPPALTDLLGGLRDPFGTLRFNIAEHGDALSAPPHPGPARLADARRCAHPTPSQQP